MDYTEWTPQDLANQLKALGFGAYQKIFLTHEICGAHLPLITEDDLEEIGITKIGHQILLMRRFSDIINGKITANTLNTPLHQNFSRQSSEEPEPDIKKSPKSKVRVQKTNYNSKPPIPSRVQTPLNHEDENAFTAPAIPKKGANSHKSDPSTFDSEGNQSSHSRRSSDYDIPTKVSRRPASQQIDEKQIPLKQTSTRSHRDRGIASSRDMQLSNDNSDSEKFKQLYSNETNQPSGSSNSAANANASGDRVPTVKCPYCGRSYLEPVAKKHIPVCGRVNANLRK